MNEGSFFRALHGAAIRVQLPLVLLTIPITAALYGVTLAPLAVEASLDGEGAAVTQAALVSVRVVVVTMIVGVAITTLGAALLLQGSIRAAVERLHAATDAIARGDFRHRVRSRRTDELGRLGASIDTMAERLERLEEARRRLLACVSHELRTPLTIIRGHAFTLARSEADTVRLERLELVQAESARLAELIEDLVDASSLHAGSVRLRVARHDLLEVTEATTSRFREEAAMHDLRIRLQGPRRPVWADIDPARLDQMLANLLSNAIRHAAPGGSIIVDVASDRASSGARRISVSNSGSPIDPALASSLFEPFVQGGERTGRVGLGLAITHGLAAAHGGELTLDHEGIEHGDVTFRIQLPAPPRAGRIEETAPAVAPRRAVSAPRAAVAET